MQEVIASFVRILKVVLESCLALIKIIFYIKLMGMIFDSTLGITSKVSIQAKM